MKNLARRERIGVLSLAIVAVMLISCALILRRRPEAAPGAVTPVTLEYSPADDSAGTDGYSDSGRKRKHRKSAKKRRRKASGSKRGPSGSADADGSGYDPFEPVPLKQHGDTAAE